MDQDGDLPGAEPEASGGVRSRSASTTCTSTKWLPEPIVPSCPRAALARALGHRAGSAPSSRPSDSVRSRSSERTRGRRARAGPREARGRARGRAARARPACRRRRERAARDLVDERLAAVAELGLGQRQGEQPHAAVDVVADPAGRDDAVGQLGGGDPADREPVALVDVRHREGRADDARQGGDVLELLEREVALDLGEELGVGEHPRGDAHVVPGGRGISQVVSSIRTSSDIEHHPAAPRAVLGPKPKAVERHRLHERSRLARASLHGSGEVRPLQREVGTHGDEALRVGEVEELVEPRREERGRSPAERSTARSTTSPSAGPRSSASARALDEHSSAVVDSSSTSSSAVCSTKRYMRSTVAPLRRAQRRPRRSPPRGRPGRRPAPPRRASDGRGRSRSPARSRGRASGRPARAEAEQLLGREDASSTGLASRDALELAELLERVDPDVRVGPDAERDRAGADALGGEEAVAEVGLRRRAGADRRARGRQEVELRAVRMGGVNDRRPLSQAAGAVEQLDRAAAVLGEARLDLARLLVRVHVERKLLAGRRSGRSTRASPRGTRARSGARRRPGGRRPAAPRPPRGTRAPTPAGTAAAPARVRDVQEHERDAGRSGGLLGGQGFGHTEVVELADRRVPGGAQLSVRSLVRRPDERRRLAPGLLEHRLAPGQKSPPRPAREGALERVAVGVHEPGRRERVEHRATVPRGVERGRRSS